MERTIIVVEDDSSIREMLEYYFKSVGFTIHCFESGEEYFKTPWLCPTLFIVDLMLPQMDGLTILKTLRSDDRTKKTPVIILTAKSAEMDRVAGLEAGADDYVVKPFGIMELHARIKAVLRRYDGGQDEKVIRYADLEINTDSRVVEKAGQPVELTYKEFELLKLLASHPGMVYSRVEILQNVWEYEYTGETRTVDMHIRTLRSKLGDDSENSSYIITVRGAGYKMA